MDRRRASNITTTTATSTKIYRFRGEIFEERRRGSFGLESKGKGKDRTGKGEDKEE